MNIKVCNRVNYVYEISKILDNIYYDRGNEKDLEEFIKLSKDDHAQFLSFYKEIHRKTKANIDNNSKIKDMFSLTNKKGDKSLFLEITSFINSDSFEILSLDEFLTAIYMSLLYKNQEINLTGESDDQKLLDFNQKVHKEKFQFKFFSDTVLATDLKDRDKLNLIEFFNSLEKNFIYYRNTMLDLENIFKDSFRSIDDYFQKILETNQLKSIKDKSLNKIIRLDSWEYRKNESIYFYQSIIDYRSMAFVLTFNKNIKIRMIKGILVDEYTDKKKEKDTSKKILLDQLKAISEENRFNILNMLSEGSMYLKELSDKTGLTSATISHHMEILINNKLVYVSNKGRKVYYHINKDEIKKLSVSLDKLTSKLEGI